MYLTVTCVGSGDLSNSAYMNLMQQYPSLSALASCANQLSLKQSVTVPRNWAFSLTPPPGTSQPYSIMSGLTSAHRQEVWGPAPGVNAGGTPFNFPSEIIQSATSTQYGLATDTTGLYIILLDDTVEYFTYNATISSQSSIDTVHGKGLATMCQSPGYASVWSGKSMTNLVQPTSLLPCGWEGMSFVVARYMNWMIIPTIYNRATCTVADASGNPTYSMCSPFQRTSQTPNGDWDADSMVCLHKEKIDVVLMKRMNCFLQMVTLAHYLVNAITNLQGTGWKFSNGGTQLLSGSEMYIFYFSMSTSGRCVTPTLACRCRDAFVLSSTCPMYTTTLNGHNYMLPGIYDMNSLSCCYQDPGCTPHNVTSTSTPNAFMFGGPLPGTC